MKPRHRLVIILLLAAGVACGAQGTSLHLGASYDNMTLSGSGGQQVTAAMQDCQSGVCQLNGSAYGTGALQSSGHYSLVSGPAPAMTLTTQSGGYGVSSATPWWFLYQTSTGSLAGELQLTQAQESATAGELTVSGTLSGLTGTLAATWGAAAAITLDLYDGAGIASLLGTSNTATASVAPDSQLTPTAGSAATAPGTAPATNGAGAAALDAYGGLSSVTVGSGSGYFRIAKVGPRWVFEDPAGHPYWMLGVFDVDLNTDTSAGSSATLAKYGGIANWGLQAVKRLQSWGFNASAEYSSAYVVPVNQDGSYETSDPLPWVAIARPAYYSLRNYDNLAPAPVKDLVNGLDAVYGNYRGDTLPDVFDPNFAVYAANLVGANTSSAMASSPWLVGTAMDDLDDLWGFGPGPDLPAARTSSNIGWIALCTNFQQTNNSALGLSYGNGEVYTKYALANWLESEYGTVAALDQAWGATYTSFGDAGGYGSGSGLLDEDGRDPWVGADDVGLSTANAQVKSDLNGFLAVFAQKYFSTVAAAIRQYRPQQLVFGPCTLNSWGGASRAAILAAAAQYSDVVQASMATQQVYDFSLQATGDHPFVTWTGMPANPDSDLAAYPNPDSPGVFTTQGARGAAYAAQLASDFAWSGSSADGALAGSQNVVGSKLWAWTDSWGERTNWGLVTFLDNAYDGSADVVAAGQDAWGFATGGEAANYGNFVGPVARANAAVLQSLSVALSQPN